MSKHLLHAIQAKTLSEKYNRRLLRMVTSIRSIVDRVDIKTPKYTGWFVLLRESPESDSGFEFVGFFNPDVSPENSEPEWSYALPIQTSESIEEFLGW